MRLTVNATVTYSDDLGLDEVHWLKESIHEDVSDLLTHTGITRGSGPVVEVKVEK